MLRGRPIPFLLELHPTRLQIRQHYEQGPDRKMDVLILQGGRDYQVSPEHDFAAWKQGLAGHPGVTFREFPTLNHMFIAGTGRSTPAEYATPGRVDPAAIATIADWVKALRPR